MPGVKNWTLTNFRLKNYIWARQTNSVHLIWTKIGMDMILDPKNKSVKEFDFFFKIQDGCWGSKIELGEFFGKKNYILARQMDPVHPVGQNLAWTYCDTLEIITRMHFLINSKWPPLVKSKKIPYLIPQITFWLNK